MTVLETKSLPKHVAIIMDGNGRWARNKGRPRVFGHKSGASRVREVVEVAGNAGVRYLTLYAFSEENWQRPKDEISALFSLLTNYLKQEAARLHENNVKLTAIGNRHKLPSDCQRLLNDAEKLTHLNDGMTLILALSYSSRSDLAHSMRRIGQMIASGELAPEDLNEQSIRTFMSTAEIPDPDLLIRTSGEKRISNFLLWEMAYTELYFTDKHWPEFTKDDFLTAIEDYKGRERRFGGIKLQAVSPLTVNERMDY